MRAKSKREYLQYLRRNTPIHRPSFAFLFYKLLQRLKLWIGGGIKFNQTLGLQCLYRSFPEMTMVQWKARNKKEDFFWYTILGLISNPELIKMAIQEFMNQLINATHRYGIIIDDRNLGQNTRSKNWRKR